MSLKYTVSYKTKFGTISAESKRAEDLEEVLAELKHLDEKIQSKYAKSKKNTKVSARKGKGETTLVLGAIETHLLPVGFFASPKSTGDTVDELAKLSGKKFTSRKVSQALGILFEKGTLHRSGERNSFAYSTA